MSNPIRLHGIGLGLIFLVGFLVHGCSSNGSLLFHKHGCIECHRFQDEGGMRGPDLTGVGQRLSNEYIDRYLRNPRAVDPQARMPAFPELSWKERRAIIAYLAQ